MADRLDDLYWRDEILSILYWFRGEGLGEVVRARDLVPFVDAAEDVLEGHLERLVADGYATRVAAAFSEGGFPEGAFREGAFTEGAGEAAVAGYQLTALGVKEGGRRFADEFAGLTGQAHGECNDPNCACQTAGPEACAHRTVEREP